MQALTQSARPDPDEASAELSRIATVYGVARGFKTREGVARFQDVWNTVRSCPRPNDRPEAIELVDAVVEKLKVDYGRSLLSATTKFLWMRFQQPIIIYDSLAWKWISGQRDGGPMKTYEDFYRVWQKRFDEHRQLIEESCHELATISPFHRPNNISSEEMSSTLKSTWFAERVFDNFICDNN